MFLSGTEEPLSQNKDSIQITRCRKVICKAKRSEGDGEDKHYNKIQTGGDVDGDVDDIVGMGTVLVRMGKGWE